MPTGLLPNIWARGAKRLQSRAYRKDGPAVPVDLALETLLQQERRKGQEEG